MLDTNALNSDLLGFSGENKTDILTLIDPRWTLSVDIRLKQRSGRKTLTIIEGLEEEFDQERILRRLRKDLACSGTIKQDEELGHVILLQGDHREKVRDFLVKEGIARKENLKLHGF